MSKSIICTNPNCSATIDVPDKQETIVCQECNTWLMVSMAESADGNNSEASQSQDPQSGTPDFPDMSEPAQTPEPPPNPNFPQSDPIHPPSIDQPLDSPSNQVLPPNLSYQEADQHGPGMNSPSDSEEKTQATPELGYLNTMTGERLKLKPGKNTVGRRETDLVINDRTISRKHCVVEVVLNEIGAYDYYVYDIGHDTGHSSTNGVYISGRSQRLEDYERIKLYNGAMVTLGTVQLTLTI